ncbi:MAG: hypothetical protein IT370_29150 [Deltaproteobacteria bacterium]|nr:hypothetical protein [Deltaproteobacteria bacterium]
MVSSAPGLGTLLALGAAAAVASACSKRKPAPPPALVFAWEGDRFKLEGTDVTGQVRVDRDLRIEVADAYHQYPTATVVDSAGVAHDAKVFSVRDYFGSVAVAGDGAAPVTVELGLPLTLTIHDGRTATTILGKYTIAPIDPEHFFPSGKPFRFRDEAPDDGGPRTLVLVDGRDGMYGGSFGALRTLSDVDLVAEVTSGAMVESKKCMYRGVGAGDEIEARFLAADVEIFDRRTGARVDGGSVEPRASSRQCPTTLSREQYDTLPELVPTASVDVHDWVKSWLAAHPR